MDEKAKEINNIVENAKDQLKSLSETADNYKEKEAALKKHQDEKKKVDTKVLNFALGFLNHVKSFYINLYKNNDVNGDYIYLQFLAEKLDVIFVLFTYDTHEPDSNKLFFHEEYSVIQPIFRSKKKRMTCIFLTQFGMITYILIVACP